MKLRRLFAMCTCIALICGLQATALGEMPQYYFFAVGGDLLWKVEEDVLVCESLTDGSSQSFSLIEENVTDVAAVADALYILAGVAGEQHVSVMDVQGNLTDSYPIPADWYGYAIEASAYGLYLLAAPDRSALPHTAIPIDASIYVLDEQNPAEFKLLEISNWENTDVNAFSVWGQFLSVSCLSDLLVYDLANEVFFVKPVSCGGDYYQVQLGPITDEAIYLYVMNFADDKLRMFNVKTHEFSDVAKLPQDNAGIVRDDAFLYSMDRLTGEITQTLIVVDNNESYEDKLVIVNCYNYDTPRMEAAVERFHEKYPNVEVVFRQENDPRVIAAGVMSGAPGFDILTTQEYDYGTCSQMLYRSGALVDLSQYEEITRWLPAYYDIFDTVTLDGHLFAVPEWIIPYMWQFNEALAEKIGLEKPEMNWTWEDFFAMADAVKRYNESADDPVYLIADATQMPYLINQYKTTSVDFSTMTANYDDEQFVALLENWKQISDDGLVKDNETMRETMEVPEDALFGYCVGSSFAYSTMMDSMWVAPPIIDEYHKLYARISSLKINSNSTHIDWAVHLLDCYMNPESFGAEEIASIGRMLKDTSYYLPESLDYFPITEESDALWKYLLENCVMDVNLGKLDEDIQYTLLPQFMSGEITAEQFAKSCQRRADMVLGE